MEAQQKSFALASGQILDLKANARLIDILLGRDRTLPVSFGGVPLQVAELTEGTVAGHFDVAAVLHVSRHAALSLPGEAQVADRGGCALVGRASLSIKF